MSTKDEPRDLGTFLIDPSAGGRARAEKLSAGQRSAIARQAATARWQKDVPLATHDGVLNLSGFRMECAVLADGTRVIKQGDIMEALGRSASSGRKTEGLPPFLEAQNLTEHITPQLREHLAGIAFRPPGQRFVATGYDATLLPEICDVLLSARLDPNVRLSKAQEGYAERAEILMRSLAKVGIVALVDEATGYEKVREHNDLQRLLAEYVAEEFRPWVKKFPDKFFVQVLRIYGHGTKHHTNKRPQFIGRFINDYIYAQLPEGVLDELQRVNPVGATGRRSRSHHQHVVEGTGSTHLDRQITAVTTLLSISRDAEHFKQIFAQAFPKSRPVLTVRPADDGTVEKLFELEDFE